MTKKLAVVINRKAKSTESIIESIKSNLDKNGISYDLLDIDNLKNGYDLVCAVGGDGTVLKSSRFYAKYSTPVMGINAGRLGFLSLITHSDAKSLGDIIRNEDYKVRERLMLKSENLSALNDFVVKGHSSIRTSKFNLFINDKLVSDYIADGIIVATPTGSTAYGLSAGGPIVYPRVEAMVIVPICAHTMTARPLVVPATEKIVIKSTEDVLDVSADGQEKITELKEVTIEQYEYRAKLAFPKDYNFYPVLRNKLNWGVSPVSEG